MSDQTPDPMDKAYGQAEALLDDEAARAARRARVLAAVADEPAAPAAAPTPLRRAPWARGRWLVAASVAGLSVIVATQAFPPALNRPRPAHVSPAAPAAGVPEAAALPAGTPTARAPQPEPKPAQRAARVEAPTPKPIARDLAAPAPPAPAPPLAPPPPPPPAAQASAPAAAPTYSNALNEIVVTAQKRAQSASPTVRAAPGSRADLAARLRDAAGAGRTDEVGALLAKAVPVDTADEDGETALMKAVKEDQPDTAALLRRRGASLDRKNQAGRSARDMAISIGDPKLNEALGLAP